MRFQRILVGADGGMMRHSGYRSGLTPVMFNSFPLSTDADFDLSWHEWYLFLGEWL